MEHIATPPPPAPRGNGPLIRRLLLIVAAASAFAFALVPLYDVFCKATGFNGKTAGGFGQGGLGAVATQPVSNIDKSRVVTVEFTGTVMPGLPWEMRPLTTSIDVHPGEMQEVRYLVHNNSDRPIVGQAVPSVSPGQAAAHFEKIECFCFTQQTLAPGESAELPLLFIVKPEVDQKIRNITLAYAFYNTVGQKAATN